jgi:hypothetical protein
MSEPTNYAVVQLPGRKFPGVVFQGDSLHILLLDIQDLRERAEKLSDEELSDGLRNTEELLSEVAAHYEDVCKKRDISLPYVK